MKKEGGQNAFAFCHTLLCCCSGKKQASAYPYNMTIRQAADRKARLSPGGKEFPLDRFFVYSIISHMAFTYLQYILPMVNLLSFLKRQ